MPESPWALVPVVLAYCGLFVVSVALTVIDLRSRRLPDVIVLPTYLFGIGMFTLACVLGAEWAALLRAGVGMAALWLFYFTLRLISRQGMGGGDVKLAGAVGLFLGWLGWAPLVVGAVAAFLLGGIVGVALLVARRAHAGTAIPFGPWMLAGAWIGIVWGASLAGVLGFAG